MHDSIRERLTEADTVSELKLLLSASKDKTCVIVEGDSDMRLFKSVFACEVELVESWCGKTGVDVIVRDYFPKEKRVIGVRDKDYQNASLEQRVFYCDYCCAEMMIIAIDDCFERVFNEHCNVSFEPFVFRRTCLKSLELLSKIRCLNEKNGWGINFQGIKPGTIYHSEQSIIDNRIINKLNQCNPKNILSDSRLMQINEAFSSELNVNGLLMITNGHDFISMFQKIGRAEDSVDAIGKSLRASFGRHEFKQTQLYNDLYNYQQQNGLNIVK